MMTFARENGVWKIDYYTIDIVYASQGALGQ